MMKLQLSSEASDAIKRISKNIQASNRYAARSLSALVSAIILEFEPQITPGTEAALAGRLVSREGRKKALLAALARVAQTADDRQLKRLESQILKFRGDTPEPAKNSVGVGSEIAQDASPKTEVTR